MLVFVLLSYTQSFPLKYFKNVHMVNTEAVHVGEGFRILAVFPNPFGDLSYIVPGLYMSFRNCQYATNPTGLY